MSETSVKISIDIIDAAAKKALDNMIVKSDNADKNLKKLGETGKSSFTEIGIHIGKASGIYDIFVGNLAANVAIKALDVLAEGAHSLFQLFIVEGVEAAKQQEEAQHALNQALAQTGIYSHKTAQEFEEFASTLQATTGVQDDVITKNIALIQSLAQLDKDGLKRATVAALNMSAALGKDLASASEVVAKAATGNVTALQKMGITIEKGIDNTHTFEAALRALEDRFGGAAAAKVNTFAGAVNLTKASFNDLQESIGDTIVKNNVVIEVLKTAGRILQELSSIVQGQSQSWKELAGEGIIFTIQALNVAVVAFDTLARIGTAAIRTVTTSFNGLNSAVYGILALVDDRFESTFNHFSNAAEKSSAGIGKALTEDTKLGEVSVLLNRLQAGAEKGFGALKEGASTSVEPLNNTTEKLKALDEEQKKANEETKNWVFGLAKANTDGQTLLDARLAQLALIREQEILTDVDSFAVKKEANEKYFADKAAAEDIFFATQQAKFESDNTKKLVSQNVYNNAQVALDDKRLKTQQKNELEFTKFKVAQEKQRQDNLKSSLSTISSLMQSSNKEQFAIGKAAALAIAFIDGQEAIVKALAAAPPPFNFALAAAVGLAVSVNIAKIASTQPPAFAEGGIVGGNSFSGDRVQAQVNSGEMILNQNQQAQLFKMANNGGSSGVTQRLDALINLISGRDEAVIVNVGGKTVVDTLRSELRAGRSFA